MTDVTPSAVIAPDLGSRLTALRSALGYRTQEEMALALRSFTGTQTSRSRISEWEAGKEPSPETLACMSLLHPDPVACLQYLREGGGLPATPRGFRPWLHQRPSPSRPTPGHGDTEVWRSVEEALARAYDKMLKRNELEGRADGMLCAIEFLFTLAATLRQMGEDASDLEAAARRLLRGARGQPPD